MGQARGRRGEKKERKKELLNRNDLDDDFIPLDQDEDNSQLEFAQQSDIGADHTGLARDNRSSFFGLLDRSELEYYKNAESVLATNALNADEREAFIDNLFVEANGKELKLATNQVCSKLVERMTHLANNEQMQQLASAFEPFAVDLAYQKFSSHCLEAVIMAAVPNPETEATMASMANRIGGFAVDLAYDRYASHVLSTLILSLSGLKENLRSKKSKLARKNTEIATEDEGKPNSAEVIEVSSSLRKCGCELVNGLIDSFDQVQARKLAIDPTSSTVAQAIIMAEASLMSGYRFVDTILSNGSAFVSHCLSDSVGSHFLDTVIKVLPAKKVSKFVDSLPLVKLASSENEASRYLVQSVICHSNLPKRRKVDLLKGDLNSSLGNNIGLSVAALNTDFESFAPIITATLDKDRLDLQQISRTALYEKLSDYGPFVEIAADSLIAMDDKSLTAMGVDPTQSFVLQSLLKASAPLIARRKLLNKLTALVPSFVLNAYGSHIVDSLWPACYKLKFARERIASELLKLEQSMKHSPYGRKVWGNWHMEKYLRKRNEWFNIVKQEEDQLREKLEPENVDRSQSSIAKAAAAAVAPTNKRRKVVG